MVTSTGSGLAVPDWPLSYGQLMPPMVGGIFYEHGHRMIATLVGLLTIGLAVWLHRRETRPWLKKLGWVALGAVCFQGLLGGLTVIFFLPTAISISHAGLAELFFALTVAIALFTSPGWKKPVVRSEVRRSVRFRTLTLWTAIAVYVQILLGALMRHTGAGLAIPDFPLAFGGLIPPQLEGAVLVHFLHRLGALVVTIMIIWMVVRTVREHRHHGELHRPVWLMLSLLVVQIALGGFTIWSGKEPLITSLHVVTGAAMWGTSVYLALRARKHLAQAVTARVATTRMARVAA
jgi:cytochrome c oxidase assembly protein subunit 15